MCPSLRALDCLAASSMLMLVLAHPASADNAPAAADSSQLQEVVVTASADASKDGLSPAYEGGQVARGGRVGIFGSEDMMETPFSSTSYTQKLIADKQAASVGDVLQNDPTIRVARGFGNFQQLYMVRGLPVYSDDMAYNGLYGLLPRQYLAAELIERVEVLRGASAFLNGAAPGGSGLGGAIDVTPKRAPNESLADFTVGVESGEQSYLATDLAARFGPDDNTGVRLAAVHRNGGTAVDGEHRRLDAFVIGLDTHWGALRVSADFGYQDHILDATQPSVTVDAGLPIPLPPQASHTFAQPWSHADERDLFGTLRAEYDVTRSVTLWIAAGARDGHEADVFANPTVIDTAGTTSTDRFDNARHDEVGTIEIGARAQLLTGPITHKLVASLDAYNNNSRNAYAFSDFAGFAGNLYAPSVTVPPPANALTGGDLANPLVTARTKTSSAAIADIAGFFNDRLLLAGGGRYQRIASVSYAYGNGEPLSSYSAGRITPVGAAVFKVNQQLSVYANYIEGLVQGDTAPDTYLGPGGVQLPVSNRGVVFEPYVTRQEEVGLKFDLGKFGGSVSLFNTSKPLPSVDISTGIYEVTSHQRNRGAELSFFGAPLPGLRVLGGASWLQTDVDGKVSIGAPPAQYTLGLEYDVPQVQGFTLTARGQQTASQYADAANTQSLDSWFRADLGARCVIPIDQHKITIRANIENVTDHNEWASAGGYPGSGYLVLGEPRTWRVDTSFDF